MSWKRAKILVAVVAVLAVPATFARSAPARTASARAEPVTVQIVAQVPDKLWNPVSPLLSSLFARRQHMDITFQGRRFALFWSNFSIGHEGMTSTDALKAAARDRTQSAFVDRPLTTAEARIFASVPVWRDADVILVGPDAPACASGLSLAAVRNLLGGRVRTWSELGAGAPATGDTVHLTVSSMVDKPQLSLQPFDVKRSPTARLDPGQHAVTAVSDPAAAVAMPWSAARAYIDAGAACAVPVGGVAPSAATIRDGSYPGAYTVLWAYPRTPLQGTTGTPNPFQRRIDALFRQHVATGAGRALILKPAGEYGPRLLP